MKTININKSVELREGVEAQPYADLIRNCCQAMQPNKPVELEEQRKRMRILDALDAAEAKEAKSMKLEDADAKKLVELVKAMPWGVVSGGIVSFSDDVIGDCEREGSPKK